MKTEKCPVGRCMSRRLRGQLMCPGCWALVPGALQHQVTEENRKARLSRAHIAACREAVNAVLERLGIGMERKHA
jgi:hypothetical protein